MSSRYDSRRRDRSRDRDERDRDRDRGRYRDYDAPRKRHSRSRSPPRRGDREKRGSDRRDYGRDKDRDDDRRDGRDRRDERRRDDRRDTREYDRDRDNRRDSGRRDVPRERERERDEKEKDPRPSERGHDRDSTRRPVDKHPSGSAEPDLKASGSRAGVARIGTDEPKSRQDSEVPTDGGEEGEAMDDTNQDDEAMMAMMGMNGFGSTKGRHVEGNQEGGANIKKIRTWRQYMNRRGGFNRPLDKIK